ncbi:DUF4334 domain-containing protein [Synechococcus sp. RSCCF101]|nr:DUF4334 domain-containing protein [Synechococcus sp. RSCCF101]
MPPLSTDAALARFDQLEPVDIEFMLGDWQGCSVSTGHPLDGLLELYHWHGKRFCSSEEVHPLVFRAPGGVRRQLRPGLLTPGLNWLGTLPGERSPLMVALFRALMPLMSTDRSGARLRITRYRGRDSATMIYDHAPINDVFRRLDANRVLGVMDMKGMNQPFVFELSRQT